MSKSVPNAVLRNMFARIMADAGYDVSSKAYTRNADGNLRATVGHVFLAKGSSGGWYAAQLTNEDGGERNMCGGWTVLTNSGMVAWLSGIECLTRDVRAGQRIAN